MIMNFSVDKRQKINNSYESEISSGSGSNVSEVVEKDNSASDNMNLLCENIPLEEANESLEFTENLQFKYTLENSVSLKSIFECNTSNYQLNNTDINSQETLNRSLKYKEHTKIIENSTKLGCEKILSNFYETILENSSNAVDMQICTTTQEHNQNEENATINDLSFNGKIEKTIEKNTLAENLNSINISDTFILRKCSNEKSPDLFDDKDESEDDECNKNILKNKLSNISYRKYDDVPQTSISVSKSSELRNLNMDALLHWNRRRDRELLRRTRKTLTGIPPPPSVTKPQMNLFTEVLNRKQNILEFFKNQSEDVPKDITCLLKPTHTLEQMQSVMWKDILAVRQHGLSYNLDKASEENDYLTIEYIDRFIGDETASSFNQLNSIDNKRQMRLKLMQSPGSRLSHLAKRRSVFSSANIAHNSKKSLGLQIKLDKIVRTKKRATPKKSTPSSKKKRKLLINSASKRSAQLESKKLGPSRETSKRALFRSPAKKLIPEPKTISSAIQMKPEKFLRLEKSKRALFSSDLEDFSKNPLSMDFALNNNSIDTYLFNNKRPREETYKRLNYNDLVEYICNEAKKNSTNKNILINCLQKVLTEQDGIESFTILQHLINNRTFTDMQIVDLLGILIEKRQNKEIAETPLSSENSL